MRRFVAFVAVNIGIALMNIGIGMILPILPLYAHAYGASSLTIGLMTSALAMGRLLWQGPGGYLSDRYQDQRIAAIGMSLYIPTMLLMALIPQPGLFVLLRFVEGTAEGITTPALYSIIATRSPEDKIGVYFGTFTAFATGGLAIGPALGGLLASIFGLKSLFLVAAGTAIIVALILSQISRAEPGKSTQRGARKKRISPLEAMFDLVKSRSLLLLIPANIFSFLTKFAFALLQVVLPLYLAGQLHVGSALIGFLFTINFIMYSFCQPVMGFLSDRLKVGYDLLLAGSLFSIALLFLPFSSSYVPFLIIFALEAFTASWITVAIRRFVGRSVEKAHIGKTFGIVGAIGDMGALIGPLIAGAIYQWRSSWPFFMAGGLGVVSVLLSLVVLGNQASPRHPDILPDDKEENLGVSRTH